jgi:hypothetical protein
MSLQESAGVAKTSMAALVPESTWGAVGTAKRSCQARLHPVSASTVPATPSAKYGQRRGVDSFLTGRRSCYVRQRYLIDAQTADGATVVLEIEIPVPRLIGLGRRPRSYSEGLAGARTGNHLHPQQTRQN